ncbi:MAG: GNAT family N-acetyltransferase [Phycisphaerae bacterium]|nr:GNAT family N-acetyltransferase [Phycisphaerae bacterium]
MVTYRPLGREELRRGIELTLMRPGCGRAELNCRVDALLRYVASMNLGIERQWGAFAGDRLVASCLCVESPGRSGMIFLPALSGAGYDASVVTELLRRVAADAEQRNLCLLQVMVEPGSRDEDAVLAAAGFSKLADLIYMEREAGLLFPASPASGQISWVTYDAERHAIFAATVEGTYEDSLDCPGLNALRTIEDILASHRATGEYDARCWFLALCDGEPAGALLLARVPEQDTMEIVYMGLLPRFRGQGIGRHFMHQAVKVARDHGCSRLTLAVDSTNAPALQLYQRAGFAETTRRRAWIAAPQRAKQQRDSS